MTGGEFLVREIIEKRSVIRKLEEELCDLEMDLSGMEIEYLGNYAVIEYADALDGQVTLYIEEEDGNSYNEMISLYDLLEIIK